ncbi:MAG: hypothetical protein VXY42_02305 [Candidatus Thermoplasmatota archaeon]|nr:hypothetical protein [Candidatus Thermoplasmatota archaeon]MEC8609318.1 hypothetical protein [Candidatus Thermoplasmatota archaeon]
MSFLDDVKENQTLQIQVICVALFLIAFPSYFFMKAAATDNPTGMGGVGTYTVDADFTYIELASASQDIADGETFSLDLNTMDLSTEDKEKNIVGVLVSLSYSENEESTAGCVSGDAADTITGTVTHLEYTNSGDGQNSGGSGSHDVSTEWYNTSVIGDKIEGLSESEISERLESNGAGLGDYTVEITVDANTGGNTPPVLCQRSDNGENVTYSVKLIVLDYSITPYVDLDDIDV